jgi:hypothetical protein
LWVDEEGSTGCCLERFERRREVRSGEGLAVDVEIRWWGDVLDGEEVVGREGLIEDEGEEDEEEEEASPDGLVSVTVEERSLCFPEGDGSDLVLEEGEVDGESVEWRGGGGDVREIELNRSSSSWASVNAFIVVMGEGAISTWPRSSPTVSWNSSKLSFERDGEEGEGGWLGSIE